MNSDAFANFLGTFCLFTGGFPAAGRAVTRTTVLPLIFAELSIFRIEIKSAFLGSEMSEISQIKSHLESLGPSPERLRTCLHLKTNPKLLILPRCRQTAIISRCSAICTYSSSDGRMGFVEVDCCCFENDGTVAGLETPLSEAKAIGSCRSGSSSRKAKSRRDSSSGSKLEAIAWPTIASRS
jgi:hypothetical protein